jgi:DNA repair protein RadC
MTSRKSDRSRFPAGTDRRRLWRAFENGEEEAIPVRELAALILGTGDCGSKRGVHAMVAELMGSHGSIAGMDRASPRELAMTPGMGPAKTLALKAAFEIGRRLVADRAAPGRRIASSRDVAALYGPRLVARRRERFFALLLNGRHELMRDHVVSIGSLTSSIVHPREAFLPAVREAAAAVIFLHNHPSGDPTPSEEDRRLTERLVEAGSILGVRVLDHVIVAGRGYVSLMDQGRTGAETLPWTGA